MLDSDEYAERLDDFEPYYYDGPEIPFGFYYAVYCASSWALGGLILWCVWP